ncbi:bifunctional homocysteine S-methyltransferase/methylenetetrahydrofolate reductase [Alicyclobacillus kakegawensis]|uniref:bifunctional homocysteine S-methyltransferase/methylenetetrahydrofolate reductase n=1 Tax=Alicyclobacillus kakegawensis TaxID=392012 RepID=UPI000830B1B8|nr:bifunctional homocysteine S-methyltransferase/methylenetetrahydrofolate reductase [Alicyclobacillus kakegawensis]
MTQAAATDFLTALRERPVIGDGAMATLLHQAGAPIRVCVEALCLTHPGWVERVHRAYIEAGASVIQTNTFSGHRVGLARHGLTDKVADINRAAVRIAKSAAARTRAARSGPAVFAAADVSSAFDTTAAGAAGGSDRQVFVLGTIGSTADLGHAPHAWLDAGTAGHPRASLAAVYEEQASALLEEGVDGILLETFPDLDELLLAIETVRSLTPLPIVATLSPDAIGVTRDGKPLDQAFLAMEQAGADVVGLNCRLGLAGILRSYEGLRLRPDGLYAAVPNGGMLHLEDGDYTFTGSAGYFADILVQLADCGVRLLGGCCGTTPAHIRALAERLATWRPAAQTPAAAPDSPPTGVTAASGQPQTPVAETDRRVTIARTPLPAAKDETSAGVRVPLDSLVERVRRKVTVIVELDPPRTPSVRRYLEGARALIRAGADAITIADNSLGTVRVSNMAIASLLKAEGIEPLVHVTCRDRNLIGQQSHLMGLHVLGIHHILLVTGDPSRFGDLPGATSVYDVSSTELTRMVRRLNQGVAFSGQPLKHPVRFVVGTSFNPHVRNFDKAVERLQRKLDAGADFVMTQPVYDIRLFERIARATEGFDAPVFVGVMPLTSARNAQFLHNEVPGIDIPESVRARMAAAPPDAAAEAGLAIARTLIEEALNHFRGIYLVTPFLRYELTVQLTEFIRSTAVARQYA